MEAYSSIDALITAIADSVQQSDPAAEFQRQAITENSGLVCLLRLLERTVPCGQAYYRFGHVIFITYAIRWPLLPFARQSLFLPLRFVGLPIPLGASGCLAAAGDNESRADLGRITRAFADCMKGITIVENAALPIDGGSSGLPALVFTNSFASFDAYMDALRTSYQRKLMAVLEKGRDIQFARIGCSAFTPEHYALYLNVCNRTHAFRIQPLDFFRQYEAELFEARDGMGQLLGFVQMQAVDGTLYLLNAGYHRMTQEASAVQSVIHYNLLLFVIRYGIEHGFSRIALGHTSAESKSKIGCSKEQKHRYITASSRLVRPVLRWLGDFFTDEPAAVDHDVFRDASSGLPDGQALGPASSAVGAASTHS